MTNKNQQMVLQYTELATQKKREGIKFTHQSKMDDIRGELNMSHQQIITAAAKISLSTESTNGHHHT